MSIGRLSELHIYWEDAGKLGVESKIIKRFAIHFLSLTKLVLLPNGGC